MLVVFEKKKGTRFGARIRSSLDASLDSMEEEVTSHVPVVNRTFFRHLFHYGIHQVLSHVLRWIAGIENALKAGLRFNRTKAKVVLKANTDSHLQKIADHKEEVALSDEEKKLHKEAALEGDMQIPASGVRLRTKGKK